MAHGFNPLDYPLCLEAPRTLHALAWHEHIPFGMALVQMLTPRILVELGVHKGDSYLALCQAVQALGLPTTCFGVDTWRGDEHAGRFGDEVLAELRGNHDALYGGFSRLLQQTFDEALAYFADGSVDLLHIDGLHTYEAVRHDFEAWRPKLSERGVVLFHDINVRERDFGVWRLWEELAAAHPHFAFKHGNGLGVLSPGAEVPGALRRLLGLSDEERGRAAELFFLLGSRLTLQVEVRGLHAHVQRIRGQLQAAWDDGKVRDEMIAGLREKVAAQEKARRELERDKDRQIAALRAEVDQINASVSFRLGMAATAPLRWIAQK